MVGTTPPEDAEADEVKVFRNLEIDYTQERATVACQNRTSHFLIRLTIICFGKQTSHQGNEVTQTLSNTPNSSLDAQGV